MILRDPDIHIKGVKIPRPDAEVVEERPSSLLHPFPL